MKITTQISLDDVLDNFERLWTIVHMKDGRILNLYIVDVDDEFQRNDEEDEPAHQNGSRLREKSPSGSCFAYVFCWEC